MHVKRHTIGLLAVFALGLLGAYSLNAANKSERRIAIYNIHTKETLDIVYKRDGKRIPAAMEKINWVMRDWRQKTPTKMDPKLIDLLWQMHTELGSREPIHLISGYRSPKTNAMLRKTRGGQAKKSRHMLGKAADVHFPDVPVRHMRYAALVRQQGGVGYYPTSAIPFVHVDTGRVRHWPRMPRYELALLFPNGRTAHRPSRGGRITKRDVKRARARKKTLATQVAAFFDSRGQARPPRPVRVASRSPGRTAPKIGAFTTTVTPAATPAPAGPADATAVARRPDRVKLASLAPDDFSPPQLLGRPSLAARSTSPRAQPSAPALQSAPRLVERPSKFKPQPSDVDRRKLTELFSLASLLPAAKRLFASVTGGTETGTPSATPPTPAPSPGHAPQTNTPAAATPTTIAALIAQSSGVSQQQTDTAGTNRFGWATGWVTAPAYDEEHPDELYYRPFALAPLLTQTSSPHDPALSALTHPDFAESLAFIDDGLTALPMKFRPQTKVAAMMWSHQFSGTRAASATTSQPRDATSEQGAASLGLASRQVRTTTQ